MNNFRIETIQIDGREPYLKIYFEDVVGKGVIHEWLNLQGFIKKVNVNEDEYCKVSAIVYLLPDSDVNEVKSKLETVLTRFEV